jgi:hypothetical protein
MKNEAKKNGAAPINHELHSPTTETADYINIAKNSAPDSWEKVKSVFFGRVPGYLDEVNQCCGFSLWTNEAEKAAQLKNEWDLMDGPKVKRFLTRSGILCGDRVNLVALGAALRAKLAIDFVNNQDTEFYGVFLWDECVKDLIKYCDRMAAGEFSG